LVTAALQMAVTHRRPAAGSSTPTAVRVTSKDHADFCAAQGAPVYGRTGICDDCAVADPFSLVTRKN
jgi:hypothetical protein